MTQRSTASPDMKRCFFAGLLYSISNRPRFRLLALRTALKFEGGQLYSLTARWIFAKHFHIRIGEYSYGECFTPYAFPPDVRVGRYVSVGPGVRVFMRNHPVERLSMHPFFYNSSLGIISEDNIAFAELEIGSDSWIGANALILGGCTRIGIGAVVGAGAVVTRSVPDFSIVAGNPARVLRRRFSDRLCEQVLASRWWEKSVAEVSRFLPELTRPLCEIDCLDTLLAKAAESEPAS